MSPVIKHLLTTHLKGHVCVDGHGRPMHSAQRVAHIAQKSRRPLDDVPVNRRFQFIGNPLDRTGMPDGERVSAVLMAVESERQGCGSAQLFALIFQSCNAELQI
jgi:hypothetical protein